MELQRVKDKIRPGETQLSNKMTQNFANESCKKDMSVLLTRRLFADRSERLKDKKVIPPSIPRKIEQWFFGSASSRAFSGAPQISSIHHIPEQNRSVLTISTFKGPE